MYLEKAAIPKMHLCIMGILLLLFLLGRKTLFAKGQKLDRHFFFLGAAFLLLEFQNISKSTLLFGSTWLVNTFTITAILLLILFANFFVRKVPIKNLKTFYLLLFISVILIYVVPLRALNVLGYWPKCVIGSIFLNIPIFFAGIIFMFSFNRTQHKNLAFGSNLLGAAFGGTLESFSFVFGINALLLLVLLFYGLSLWNLEKVNILDLKYYG
jgi:hypothetical protein